MTPAEKAQALASDLRYVLRKHEAQIVCVTVTAVIEGVSKAGSLVAALGPRFPWRLLILANVIVTVVYFIIIKSY
jgi:hypothetical protein